MAPSLAVLAALFACGCGREPSIDPPATTAVIRAARQFSSKLDYVAADYPATFRIKNDTEERKRQLEEQLAVLEEAAELAALLPRLEVGVVEPLIRQIEAEASPSDVATTATKLADDVLTLHGVEISPLQPPDLQRAEALYSENCVKCHGELGAGDGRDAQPLKIKPRSFLDKDVMESMSPRRAFSALTDGIERAEMPDFSLLAAEDRWSLAFYVMTLRHAKVEARDPGADVSLTALANSSDEELRATLQTGEDPALAHARSAQGFESSQGILSRVQAAVADSIGDHRAGKRAEASARIDAALSESFSTFRPGLSARASALTWRIERALYDLRASIPGGAAAALEQRALSIQRDLQKASEASEAIHPLALAGAATLGALGWLVVLLFVGRDAAYSMRVAKAGRAIHLGWVVALLAGLATILTGDAGALVEASSRHQVSAVLRLLAALVALAAMVIVVRRLATTPAAAAVGYRLPWWLTMVSFVCAYGGVLEWSHHMAHLAAESGRPGWQLALAGLAAAAALAGMLSLLLELAARSGRAAHYGIVAIVALFCAVALAGGAARGLVDGGTIAAARLGDIRVDLVALYPLRWVATAQLATTALGVIITAWGVIARR